MPTKALIHRAGARRDGDDPGPWFAESVGRRDALVDRLRARNRELLDEVDAVTLIDGHARFVGPHEVEVTGGDERLTVRATTIVVNTGTVPAPPAIPGARTGGRIHDSTTLQHVEPLPERLVIVGAGVVGLEFAGMFAGFGSRVTVVASGGSPLPHEDPDVADAVRSLLAEQGVTFALGVRATALDERPDDVTVTLDDGATLAADAVLLATGRAPATTDLGLDAAGIDVDPHGHVVVDDRLRTTAPGVFAVGDVNGGPRFTYVSLDDHRIVLDQLTGPGTRRTTDRVAVPTTTFLTPPLAGVGLTEAEARATGRPFLVASKPIAAIAAMPRPKAIGDTRGLIKVLVDAETDAVTGATWLGVDAQETINLVALAMRAGVTATELRDGIWTHPSSTEALNEVLGELHPAG
ncbi:MAG: FAD-dependent oxidoreductase [Solirubrobacteraceae bacterium]|nr:FAD-dependent oxidoreductase [Solirubrobacteraceae bacterium]